jgi:hypothetical protein
MLKRNPKDHDIPMEDLEAGDDSEEEETADLPVRLVEMRNERLVDVTPRPPPRAAPVTPPPPPSISPVFYSN